MKRRRVAVILRHFAACAILPVAAAGAQSTVTTSGGTANYVPTFTGSSSIGNSNIYDDLSNGWVGIRTTTPGRALDVAGSVRTTTSGSGGNYVAVDNDSSTNITSGPFTIISIQNTSATPGNNALISALDANGNPQGRFGYIFGDHTGSYQASIFIEPRQESSPSAFVVASTGDVGIGTAGPLSPLSVSGQLVIGTPYRGDASLHINQSFGGYGRFTQMEPSGASQNALNLMGSNDSNGNTQWFSWGVNGGNWTINPGQSFGTAGLTVTQGSNVGIGTTTPGQQLEVAGYIKTDQGIYFPGSSTPQTTPWTGVVCGGDYAESVNVTGDRTNYEPGDVLVVDPDSPGKFLKSAEPYSTAVTGVYSTKPGVVGRRQATPASPHEVPMAMIGIVPTKVSAENGPIRPGDLLVTSSTIGYAMKGTDRSQMLGAVIGKALGSLSSGTGVIEVAVTLQ